jgi:hypothetical protein
MDILLLGDSKEKLEDTFKMYEIDHNGMIKPKEISIDSCSVRIRVWAWINSKSGRQSIRMVH